MRTLLGTMIGVAMAAAVVGAQAPDAKKVDAGMKAYDAAKCSTCHQIKGVGGKMSTSLDGVATRMPEADIKKWLTSPADMEAKLPKKPVMAMSAFLKSHKLTDADESALLAYMLTLK